MENQVPLSSLLLEGATLLSALIFAALVSVNRLLPKEVRSSGKYLFLSLGFITTYYLLVNLQQEGLALVLFPFFMITIFFKSYFFYRFNTVWLKSSLPQKWGGILKYALVFIGLLVVYTFVSLILAWEVQFEYLTRFIMTFLYLGYALLVIIANALNILKEEKTNLSYYTSERMLKLKGARTSLLFYVLFVLGMLLSGILDAEWSEIVFNLSFLVFVLYLGYFNVNILIAYVNQSQKDVPLEESKGDDQQSQRFQEWFTEINHLVTNEKLFLDKELSVAKIGQELELNSKYVSQAINEISGKNFNQYINEKRVSYAKELLVSPEFANYSIEAIAEESGFKSKSTFNNTFKKLLGSTPSVFRTSHFK